jgi:predicted transposase/invertase (TIGR01784 family)
MSKQKRSPHSEFFVNVIGRRENALDLLKQVLPESIQRHLVLDSLDIEKGSYVDEKLHDHFSDLVFSVKLKNGRVGRIYCLLEHKSAPEYLVALQLLRYMALEWNEMLKQEKIYGNKLPPIIPIVVYQGHDDWPVSQEFQSVVDFPSDDFKAYVPNFHYALWNLEDVDEQKLQESLVLKYYVQICKALNSPKLPDYVFDLVEAFIKTLDSKTATEYIEIFFSYLARSSGRVSKETFEKALKRLPEGGGEKIMNTLAEQWIKEGEQRGEQRGVQKGKLEAYQEMLISAIQNKFGVIKPALAGKIRSIQSIESLDGLFSQVFKVEDKKEFISLVDEVLSGEE